MKRKSLVLLALTLVFGFGSAVSAADDNRVQSSLIVSTEWVAKHLNDDGLVKDDIRLRGDECRD